MLITSSTNDAVRSATAGASDTWLGMFARQVDAAGDDECQRRHPQLGDRWQPALVHPDASFVMIRSVAICMSPRTPAQ